MLEHNKLNAGRSITMVALTVMWEGIVKTLASLYKKTACSRLRVSDGLPAQLPLWMKAFIKGPRAPRFTLNVYTEINTTVSQVADWWTLTARTVSEIIHHRGWWRPSRPFFSLAAFHSYCQRDHVKLICLQLSMWVHGPGLHHSINCNIPSK